MNTAQSGETTTNFSPLWRPEKINWVYKNPDPNTVLDRIKSKSARSFLRSLDEVLAKYNLTVTTGHCSLEDFLLWSELYLQRSAEKNFDLFASDQWYEKKAIEKKRVEKIFIFQGNVLIGGKIITVSQDNIVRSAFKASIEFPFTNSGNASLGLLLDYIYLLEYSKQNVSKITGGHSRNLFGIINTIGYLCFKLRMGYLCEIDGGANNYEKESVTPTGKSFCTFLAKNNTDSEPPNLYFIGDQLYKTNKLQELETLHQLLVFNTHLLS